MWSSASLPEARGVRPRLEAAASRGLDLTVAGLGLAVTWPLLSGLALAVRLESPGPALHRAVRLGRHGQPFVMLKLRTMRVGAEVGPAITGADDRRITRLGRRLRATRLDELPQLINVLRGEMSLVGPRPEAPRYLAHYTPEQRGVLAVRPGITGPTQLRYRDEAALLTGPDVEAQYLRELLPAKLASDLAYVRGRSLGGDLRLLATTLGLLLGRSPGP